MWAEIAAQREQFIGGILQDLDTSLEPLPITVITDVSFSDDSFRVDGEEYCCGGNRNYLWLRVEDGWFELSGPYGHFRFRAKPAVVVPTEG